MYRLELAGVGSRIATIEAAFFRTVAVSLHALKLGRIVQLLLCACPHREGRDLARVDAQA